MGVKVRRVGYYPVALLIGPHVPAVVPPAEYVLRHDLLKVSNPLIVLGALPFNVLSNPFRFIFIAAEREPIQNLVRDARWDDALTSFWVLRFGLL